MTAQDTVCDSKKPKWRWCSSRSKQGWVGMLKIKLNPTPVMPGLMWSQHKTVLRKQGYLGTVRLEICMQKPPMWKAQHTSMIYQGAGSSWAMWEVLWRLSHSREEEQLIKLCLLLPLWSIFKGRFRRRKMKLLFVEFLHIKIHIYVTEVKENKRSITSKRWKFNPWNAIPN